MFDFGAALRHQTHHRSVRVHGGWLYFDVRMLGEYILSGLERRGADQESALDVGAVPGEEAGIHVRAKELRHQTVVRRRRAVHVWDRGVIGWLLLLLVIHGRPGLLGPVGLCPRPGGWRAVGAGGVRKNKLKIQELIQVLVVFSAQAAAVSVGDNAVHVALPPLERG